MIFVVFGLDIRGERNPNGYNDDGVVVYDLMHDWRLLCGRSVGAIPDQALKPEVCDKFAHDFRNERIALSLIELPLRRALLFPRRKFLMADTQWPNDKMLSPLVSCLESHVD